MHSNGNSELDVQKSSGDRFTIILATYNRAELLGTTLESLSRQMIPEGVEIEMFLIDNNSTDSTKSVAEKWLDKLPFPAFYRFEPKQGKSYALNRGIDEAKGDLILITDDDVTLEPNWIYAMHDAMKRYPDASGLGGRVVPQWPKKIPHWLPISGSRRLKLILPETDMGNRDCLFGLNKSPVGCNSAFRRFVFDQGLRFRTDICDAVKDCPVSEDTKFGYEVHSRGYQMMYVHDAVVYHPSVPERLTKKYARRRYFYSGVVGAQAYDKTRFAGLPRICGIYRYLFPESLGFFLKWLFFMGIGRWRDSFYYEVMLLSNLGQIKYLWSQNCKRRSV